MNIHISSTKNTRNILPDSMRFVRSDVPTGISSEDIKWLTDSNIRTIVDLREDKERAQKPCPLADDTDFEYICLPVTGGNGIPESPDKVPVSYLNMIDEQLIHIIDVIENAETNVLYFCNAGKDRTGVVYAILLKRQGFDDEYIIEDYMKSTDNLKDMLKAFAANNSDVDINVITPHREYMKNFLRNCDELINQYI